MRALVFAFSLALTATACSNKPLVPDKAVQLTAGTAVQLSTLWAGAALAGAVYVVYDPLAPNWEIEEAQLAEDTYRFSLTMKRFHTGGAGEALQIMKRRAGNLQHQQGFENYQILEYTEGIDSRTLGARRVAEGVIRLVQRKEADSFNLNHLN